MPLAAEYDEVTSAGVGYFSLGGSNEKEFVRWDLLNALPGEKIALGVRHVRLTRPLSVRMDGQTQQGVISLPGPRAGSQCCPDTRGLM